MIVTLHITNGDKKDIVFRLVEGESKVIGRSPRADIVLHDDGASRRHCRVRITDSLLRIADLNSKNGTLCNGKVISGEVTLNNRDLLQIGHSCWDVRIYPTEKDYRNAAATSSKDTTTGKLEPPRPHNDSLPPPSAENNETLRVPPAAQSGSGAEAEAKQLIGEAVAGYRIDVFLGKDDISYIYGATQLSMDRKVQLKILSPEMTQDGAAIDRFIQAARAAGKLCHPNIVQVYDAGQESDRYFIALERVAGRTLRRQLQGGKRYHGLPLAEALNIADQLADALTYAHAQSVVHRNLSLDCIYLTPHKVAKVADLGFSKNLADSGLYRPVPFDEQPERLHFLAPEQLVEPRGAGLQADIYAMGAVLFVMLSGQMPFRGKSAEDIFVRVRDGRRENLQRVQPDLPFALVEVVDHAMAPRRKDRYQSASAFLNDLRKRRGELKI